MTYGEQRELVVLQVGRVGWFGVKREHDVGGEPLESLTSPFLKPEREEYYYQDESNDPCDYYNKPIQQPNTLCDVERNYRYLYVLNLDRCLFCSLHEQCPSWHLVSTFG
jgi:hypothetical protein